MAIHARGDIAVVTDGDYVTVLIAGQRDTAYDLRKMVAGVLEMIGSSLSNESWQRLSDMHATLSLALGEPTRTGVPRPRQPRDKIVGMHL